MEKKWFIGIDISKKTLDIFIYSGNPKKADPLNYKQIFNNEEGFKELISWFKERKMKFKQIVIQMEHTGIYGFDICLFLEKKKIDYNISSPIHLIRSMGFNRGKNDKIDALRLASYCYIHRDTMVYTKLKDTTIHQLRELSAEHKRYVKQAALHKGLITDRVSRQKTQTYKRSEETLKFLEGQIAAVERQMNEIIKDDKAFVTNYLLLKSIKGVGAVNAINTLLHTNNFTSFENARKYACYIGIAPFEHTSGTSIRGRTRVSKYGNKMLKADLTQAAKSAIRHDGELKEYYNRKKQEGKEYGVIINAVKFKLICRMFAVINRGTEWVDVKKYAS